MPSRAMTSRPGGSTRSQEEGKFLFSDLRQGQCQQQSRKTTNRSMVLGSSIKSGFGRLDINGAALVTIGG
eukprot:CAMPEP_0185824216 /NCGR_PEP_ID=MMETSP1322-20130828/29336_1 /TAXON_ID=265543 /ORGANISM="Minutocellus polymorphus, Strain RCC2270" /LENGTH=69 /DNA_ID=CAMNT_0028521831 /DNA_START=344 /DNA_END=550 /DNA_ORIENTATION=+